MAKNKKFMVSTGFVGLTALALTLSPAFAAPNTETNTEKDKERAVVYEVETLGESVSITEEDLKLPEDVDFNTFGAAVEKDAENVKTEDVLDEEDVKTGEKVVLTIEEQGTWSFESDLEGNLLNIDFTPVEGFEGDPVLDYVTGAEDEEFTGTITLDYPNEEKAEEITPLTDEELAELEKAEEEAKAEETEKTEKAENTDSDSEDKETVEEKVLKPVVEDVVPENLEVEEDKEPVVKVMSRTLAAPALAPVLSAPAAPVPAEGLDPNFAVPELNGQSNGSPVKLTFGDNGEDLPAGADASTVDLIIGTGADQESTLSNGNKQLDIPNVGTFKVDEGGKSFTFEPVSGYSGTAIGHYVVQDEIGNFSNEGRLVVGVSPSGNTAGDGEDSTTGVNPDEATDDAANGDNTVNPDGSVSSGDPLAEDPTMDNGMADDTSDVSAGNEAARDNLSNTGVDAAPVGIAAAALAFIGGAFALVASRLKKNNI